MIPLLQYIVGRKERREGNDSDADRNSERETQEQRGAKTTRQVKMST